MTDEDGLIKASKNKGRSASVLVCFSSRSESDRVALAANAIDHVDISSPSPTPTLTDVAPTPAASEDDEKYFRRPVSRSQSVRLAGAKSFRRRALQSNNDILGLRTIATADDHHSDSHPHQHQRRRLSAGVSEPKLYSHSYGFSASEQCHSTANILCRERQCSARPENSSTRNFRNQRKSAAFLDVPETQFTNQKVEDDNSYRLRSFSFTTKGLVNRGDSFKKRHGRSNSIFLSYESSNDKAAQRHEILNTSATTAAINASVTNVFTYNVIVMGTANVGKTSLINQFMTSECINPYDRDRDEPSQQTISIMLNGEESELCFHELKHSNISQQKFAAADAFLLLYSVVDKSTFQYAESELAKLQDSNILLNKPAILVANKIDLARSRMVSLQDGKCLACTFHVKHVEVSVGINHNVDQLLVGVLNQIHLKKQRYEQENTAHHHHYHQHHWYKNRAIIRASMKARQMFTWVFGREDSKFKNCENLHTL